MRGTYLRSQKAVVGLYPKALFGKVIWRPGDGGEQSLDERAAPFREAFAGVSEEELDRRVKAARAGRRKGSTRHRR